MSSTSAEEEKPRRKRAVRGSVKDAEEAPKKKAKAKPKKKVVSDDDGEESPSKEDKKPRKKAADHQVLTEREELPKLWNAKEHEETSHTLKICSWNVAGLRALLRNHPETLPNLVKEHDIDVLCLQETKLQEMHLDDKKLLIRDTVLQPDYDAYYSCSTAKKGYSGTAVFVKRHGKNNKKQATLDSFFGAKKADKKDEKKQETDNIDPDDVTNLIPTDVSYKMGVDDHDQEGRLIIADFPLFSLVNLYVPNSGQKLERLDYRTEQWDKDLLKFVQAKSKPVVWLGDLNVAHTNLEVWNDGAKHLAKQAGVTQQERDSFQHQLDTSGFQDAFRALHPTAKGCYSYWSQRAGNREPNKGLRLDYFCCASELFDDSNKVVARDSYMLYDVHGSDHCPVVLELEIKK